MGGTCYDEADARAAALDQLRVEVLRRDDQFLVDGGDYGYGGEWFPHKELNEYAIAEWAWSLLERQKAAMVEAVEAALGRPDDNDEGPGER